ncbi:MAG: glycosyltransferase [Pseudomonadota bacterium]
MFDFASQFVGNIYEVVTTLPLPMLIILSFLMISVELPKYTLGFIVIMLTRPWRDYEHGRDVHELGKFSVIIAGHNEEDAIETCVRSLDNQTVSGFEIICVDDGSSDRTFEIMTRLEREGLIHRAVRLELRGGKASALNMATRLATGDVFIILDADSNLEVDAVETVLMPLFDPTVHAVSGTVLCGNPEAGWVAKCQAIEYAVGIPLGRTLLNLFDQLVMVSGAFGAFKREAWEAVGGMDVGPGEDFDLCMRMRRMGYGIGFYHKSICYTDVPDQSWNLVRQRMRWERDAVWVRFRKLKAGLNPLSPVYRTKELWHNIEFMILTVIPTFAMYFYLMYLMGTMQWIMIFTILGFLAVYYMFNDLVCLCMSAIMLKRTDILKLIPYIPIMSCYNAFIMRGVRAYTFVDEWIFSRSMQDDFAPFKVQNWRVDSTPGEFKQQ